MQAIWLENQRLEMRDVPSAARPGEVLLRVRLAGVCGTDLELVKGYYPYAGIPGHEFVGQVIDPASALFGKRVTGEINVSCGACEQCRDGRGTHCERRSVLGIIAHDGVFAETASLPLANLHVVPDGVPDEMAVFCEPLAAALEIQEQVHIHPTDRVLLVGAGRLGQLIAQTLQLTGAGLHVLARHPRQKELLEQRGIRLVDEQSIQPWRYDVVIEATGSPAGFEIARKAVRPRGSFILKSTYHGDLTLNMSSIVVDEVNISGSRCGPFEPALRLMAAGLVDPSVLVAEVYPLGEGLRAFERAASLGMLKVLVRP